MKRPRSYGENLDEAIPGEKGVFKEWGRRDQDSDRPSSHRRFYPKGEIGGGGRKGSSSSSYDRAVDDDREPLSRSLSRKRFDHDQEGFDRRKFSGGFERYREEEERSAQASSPRVSYGGDRIHRSERFSLSSRRDYPKGFRSERERPRREGSSGSSWRRSSVGKEATDEEAKTSGAASVDPVACGGHRLPSEDRGKTKPKESSSGDQPAVVEVKKKTPETRTEKENCSSSEMEEGELEPDPEPEPKPEPDPELEPIVDVKPVPASVDSRETTTDCRVGSGLSSESGRKSPNEYKVTSDEEDASVGKVEVMVVATDPGKGTDEVSCHEIDPVKQVDENDKPEEQGCEKAPTTTADGDRGLQVTAEVENSGVESPQHKQEGSRKEQFDQDETKDVLVLEEKMEENVQMEKGINLELQVESERKEERCINLEMEPNEAKDFDLETDAEAPMDLFGPSKEAREVKNNMELTLKLMTGNNDKDKGKSLAVSLSNEANSVDEDTMEGPSSRGFELVFQSDITRLEKGSYGGIVIGKHKEAKCSLEPLDLSLSLPGVSLGHSSQDPKTRPNLHSSSQDQRPRPTSPVPRSIQSLPSSFYTNSEGFTASISFSGSQTFVHNPSCSLTQNSMENYEHSVGSRPIFQGIDQATNGTLWQGQPSNESKCKGANVPLYQRSLLNGKLAQHSSHPLNGLAQQSSLPKQLSPTNSHGSRDTRSEHSKKALKRERSSASLFRSEQQEAERVAFNGSGVIERVLTKIVSEPLQIVSRMIQEMTEQSVTYLRQSIGEMVINRDKLGHLCALQEMLQKRTDITPETLSKCHQSLLEILVALRTGLPDFLRRANNIPASDLAEIFLNLKCRNLACRSILPVDECDCKVCAQKNGFCSACMCLVCSKFDLASNTCSWVGCDVCLHWCHTDCALRDSHIRNGSSVTGAQGNTEMQFHCVACGHPSEMFGFVKEVFKTCAKDWKPEILAKELEYVRRIFSASEDSRGKRLRDVADQLLVKLENKVSHSEVTRHILSFLVESDSNLSNGSPSFPQKDRCEKNTELTNGLVGSRKETLRLPDASVDKSPRLENGTSILPSLDVGHRRSGDVELQRSLDKQQGVDELDSVVKFKQAEAKMYQARADDARKEAEGLKRIAVAKREKIEEEYSNRIAKLRLVEAEEKRKQKFEELQALERAHHEYFNMKMRMEADIKNLLFKMEATKRNFNT